jgi:hypothetical protein
VVGHTPELAVELAELLLERADRDETRTLIGRIPPDAAMTTEQRSRLEALRSRL